MGALNSYLVTRSPFVGIAVLLVDFAKGYAAVEVVRLLFGGSFLPSGAGAIGAIVGHNYSVWLKGEGGRGLATAAGAVLTIAPVFIVLWIALWAAGYGILREVNVASAAACCIAPMVLASLPDGIWDAWIRDPGPHVAVSIVLILCMAIILAKLFTPVVKYLKSHRRL